MKTVLSKHESKPCPFCAELIRKAAVKCRFCGEFLYGDQSHTCLQPQELEDEEAYEYEEEEEEEYEEDEEEEEGEENEEDILYAGRPSIFTHTHTLLGALILVTLCGAIYYQPLAQYLLYIPKLPLTDQHIVAIEQWLNLGSLIAAITISLYALFRVAELKSTYYEVTPDRIEWSRGIFSRKVDNIDMFRIVDLKLRRSLWDCLVGVGTVYLVTKDDSDPSFAFVKVRHCRALYDVVKKAGLEADREQGVIHLE